MPPRLLFLAPGDVRKARVEPISWMRTAEAFAARGAAVTLLTLRVRRPDGVERSRVFEHFGVQPRFRLVEFPTPLTKEFSTTQFRMAAFAAGSVAAVLACLDALVRGRAWVLYARAPVLLAPAIALRRLLPARRRPALVYETHVMPTEANLRRIAATDLVVVNSERLAGDLRARFEDGSPRVLHAPLPPFNDVQPVDKAAARASLGLPAAAAIACYTGKMVRDQLEFMLQVARRCADRVPGFELLLVGGNPEILAWARGRAEELGVTGAVRFAGFVAPSEVAAYQSAADVLVFHMSPQLTHYEYCTPAKAYEYQVIGRPIVAADIPLFEEVFGADGQRAVRVRDPTPEAMADGIAAALALPPAEAEAMAERARTWVRPRSWQARADAVLELLDR